MSSQMSSSSSLTNCCICLERMKQPIKTLPCLHSSCSTCIDGLIKMGQKPFKCPLCRSPFEAPATLPPNYFTSYLLASDSPRAGGNDFDPNDIKCEICEENEAEEYCKDCGQFFCLLPCKKVHLKTKNSVNHQFVSLDDGLEIKQGGGSSSSSASTSTRTTRCHNHSHLEVNSYCEQCKEACCAECVVDNHSGHRVVRLSTMAEIFKGEISTSMDKVKHFDNQLSEAIKEITDTLTELNKQAKVSEEHVHQLFEKLRLMLAEREAELLGEIEKERHQKEKELGIQKEEFEFLLKGVRDSLSFGEKLVSEGSGVEITASHKQVTGRFETLVNEMMKTPLSPATDEMIELVEEGDATKVIKQIGMIVATEISSEKSKVVLITNGGRGQRGMVNEEYSFEVHLVDKKGEKARKLSPAVTPFQVNLAGPSRDVKVNVSTKGRDEEGIRKVSMRPNQVGNHEVSVVVKGRHLEGSPFKLDVRMVYRRDYARVNDQPVVRFGSEGEGDGQFQSPYSVACNSKGDIIVADCNNHRIQVFDKDGKFLFKFGSNGKGNGQFNQPHGVIVDHRNNNQIVVADFNNHRIQVFDRDGKFLFKFGSEGNGEGQFNCPYGIVVDQTNGNSFVTDVRNHRVQVFNSEGKFIRKFGSYGNGNGRLNTPSGTGLLSNGNVVVSEYNNNRLQIFTPEGDFVRMIGVGQVSLPGHLFVDSDDNILVADYDNGRIRVFNKDGHLVKSIGSGRLSGPAGVSMDHQGRIVVSEAAAHRISIF